MNRPSLTALSLASSLFTLALFAPSAHGAAMYTTDDNGATLIVTVDSGTETLDASQVVAGITNIVKRGAGKLNAVAIASYTGDFDVEEGIWCCTDANQFGATSTTASSGTIHVRDGASIEYTGSNQKPGVANGKTIHLYGAAATAVSANSGKIVLSANTLLQDPGFGKNMTIVLHDDAQFWSANRLRIAGTFDLGGHKLTLRKGAHDLGGFVTNGGVLSVYEWTTLMTEGTNLFFSADCAQDAYVEIGNGATLNLKSAKTTANGWTLRNNGGTMTGNQKFEYTKTDFPIWEGPVVFSGNSKVASYTGSSSIPTTVFNLSGDLSGSSGTLAIGPGWLNLHSAVNTYAGAVTVTSVGNAAVPAGAGGIGIFNGAACFPNASSVTFNDSSRLEFRDIVPASLPRLTFAGNVAQSISGGLYSSRSSVAGLTKTGTGVLTISSPIHVTDTATVASGTLRVPSSIPGLYEYHVTPKTSGDQNYVYLSNEGWGFCEPWTARSLAHIDIVTNGVNPSCAAKTYSTVSSGWGDGCTLRNGWWYHGYVWNHADEPVTWKLWSGMTTGVKIWLGADRSTQLEFRGNGGKPAYAQEVTIQPGATPIDIFVWSSGNSLWPFFFNTSGGKRYGLRYAPPGTTTFTTEDFNDAIDSLPAQYSGSAYKDGNVPAFVAMAEQFSNFGDDGSGEVFTATYGQDPDADLATLVAQLPIFDDMAFPSGATLDLDDNRVFPVKNLTGSPTVENAGVFGITNCWTILAADFPKTDSTVRHPMTVNGMLGFTEGATFSIDDEAAIARDSNGLVVATATGGITGTPTFAGGPRKWRLAIDGNSLRLFRDNITILFFR